MTIFGGPKLVEKIFYGSYLGCQKLVNVIDSPVAYLLPLKFLKWVFGKNNL